MDFITPDSGGSNHAGSRNGTPVYGDSNGSHVKRTRVGVIGCGYWGPQLVRNLNDLPEAELMGVADQSPERLQYVRQHYPHARLFHDHTELLSSDVEAVVIATPIRTHYELA